MKEIIKAFGNLPWIVKIIFCLPALDIIWAVYRIIKGIDQGDPVKLIAGIIWIPFGASILWILDIVCVLLKKPLLLA